jgi:PAS domain S-box-containing protein
MNRASVGIKVGIAFAFLILLLMGIGLLEFGRMSRISTDLNDILGRRWAKIGTAHDAVFFANLSFGITSKVLLLNHRDTETVDALLARRATNTARISDDQRKLETAADSDQERALLAKIDVARVKASTSIEHLLQLLVKDERPDDARQAMLTITMPLLADYHDAWNTFIQFQVDQMEQAKNRAQQNSVRAWRLMAALILLAIFIAMAIAVIVTRKLVREITQCERVKLEVRKLNEGLEVKVQERTQQLARVGALVEACDDSIVGATIDGVIRSWNPGAERIYGYSADEMIGKSPSILVPTGRPHEVELGFEKARNGERIKPFECIRERKDGRQILVSVTISSIRDPAGKIDGFALVTRDISQSRHIEGSLRQAQKMEAVGRLAGGVAHDFNNLLGVIIGYSDLILDESQPNQPIRKHAEQIKKAGEQAAALTGKLLAFSRQQVFETRVLNLNAIVADMREMLVRVVGPKIELSTSLGPATGQVKADQGQIEQVLMNLVVNARDAMPEGGTLFIETTNATLTDDYVGHHQLVTPGSYILLAVCDTGTGMDAATKAHIFEPFFTTKPQGKGTGLGLATVYGIIKQSGGFIWVYSEPGLGSTFKVYLPRVGEQVQDLQPAAAIAHFPARSETILLVEDEPLLRNLTSTLLRQAGYTVLEADSGEQAIDVAERYHDTIHLLLTDMIMPGMRGPAAAQQLIRSRPGMRVIYMSGYIAFAQRGLLDRDATVLAKPFTKAALLQKLTETLRSQANHPAD